jgi:hypothetical protein
MDNPETPTTLGTKHRNSTKMIFKSWTLLLSILRVLVHLNSVTFELAISPITVMLKKFYIMYI